MNTHVKKDEKLLTILQRTRVVEGGEVVHILSAPHCPQCRAAKGFLAANKYFYAEIMLESNQEIYQYIKDNDYKSLPVIVLEDATSMDGFNPRLLISKLRKGTNT